MKSRLLGALLGLWACSCASAKLVRGPAAVLPERVGPAQVIVEPFFENSQWNVTTQARTATVNPSMAYGGFGGFGGWGGYGGPYGGGFYPQDITVYQDVAVKPVFARPPVLAQEQALVIAEVQRLRPEWRVYSTQALQSIQGPVKLVRVVIGDSSVIAGNRMLKSLAFGFGFVLPPLWLFEIDPVDETQRVQGMLIAYDGDAVALKKKLVRYPSQPDFAVDTRGLPARFHPFALDVRYREGLFASEGARAPALVSGFTERLAQATVALVEGL